MVKKSFTLHLVKMFNEAVLSFRKECIDSKSGKLDLHRKLVRVSKNEGKYSITSKLEGE